MRTVSWPTGQLLFAALLSEERWVGILLDFQAHSVMFYDPGEGAAYSQLHLDLFIKITNELLPALWKYFCTLTANGSATHSGKLHQRLRSLKQAGEQLMDKELCPKVKRLSVASKQERWMCKGRQERKNKESTEMKRDARSGPRENGTKQE